MQDAQTALEDSGEIFDLTSEQLEISNQLKAQIQPEIQQYVERK